MNTLRGIRRENKYLQREIYIALSGDRFAKEEQVRLQHNFIKNYYEIIKLSFDLSITKEKLNKYSKNIKNYNHPNTLLKIAKVVENENTYILINRYLKEFLQLL